MAPDYVVVGSLLVFAAVCAAVVVTARYRERRRIRDAAYAVQDFQRAEQLRVLREMQIEFQRDWSRPAPKGFGDHDHLIRH